MSDTERDRAFWQNPKADIADFMAFALGWSAAMKFMASPRIPCLHPTDPLQRQYYVPTPVHPGRDDLGKRFAGDLPPVKWSERDLEVMYRAAEAGSLPPKEHNPHGLVAFYTDAP